MKQLILQAKLLVMQSESQQAVFWIDKNIVRKVSLNDEARSTTI